MRNIPATIVPLILFNLVAFLFSNLAGAAWQNEVASPTLFSGEQWKFTAGDVIVVIGLVALFWEVLSAASLANRTIGNHLVSILVLIVYVIEFLIVGRAANSTFFILTVIALIDVLAGIVITIRLASRDIAFTDRVVGP
jgi:hypothetical protein